MNKKVIYYRLSQVDYNGDRSYLGDILKVNFRNSTQITVYPIPVAKGQALSIRGASANEKFAIYNHLGKLITSGSIEPNNEIKIVDMNTGLYILKFDNGELIRFIVE